MISPTKEIDEPSSTANNVNKKDLDGSGAQNVSSETPRPPAKRRLSSAVIEISDTESDDSDICAVNTYQASADEVKRIRGDYSSTSSSSDYSSDSESPWEDDSIVLDSPRDQTKLVQAQLNPRANRMDEPKLNAELKSQELIERLTKHWMDQKDYSSDQVTITCEPFRLCLFHNLLSNPDMINNIVDDMNTLDWTRKKMDLYEFHQTTDLASLTWQRSIRGIYDLLKTDVMNLASRMTGLRLQSVSASCSLYGPGDHLLPHDDRCADRRLAFVLYLAPWRPRPRPLRPLRSLPRGPRAHLNGTGTADADIGDADNDDDADSEPVIQVEYEKSGWYPHMGGALELLAADERGLPAAAARAVLPANNMLALFKVDTRSFHQVSEVMSFELPRLSINGWFHGPAPEPEPPLEPAPPARPEPLRPHTQPVSIRRLCTAYITR